MQCKQACNHLSAYLDGELSAELAAAVRAHVATCPACRQMLEELQATANLLGRLPVRPAPRALAADVLREVECRLLAPEGAGETAPSERTLAIRRAPRWPRVLAVAACVALASGIGLLAYLGNVVLAPRAVHSESDFALVHGEEGAAVLTGEASRMSDTAATVTVGRAPGGEERRLAGAHFLKSKGAAKADGLADRVVNGSLSYGLGAKTVLPDDLDGYDVDALSDGLTIAAGDGFDYGVPLTPSGLGTDRNKGIAPTSVNNGSHGRRYAFAYNGEVAEMPMLENLPGDGPARAGGTGWGWRLADKAKGEHAARGVESEAAGERLAEVDEWFDDLGGLRLNGTEGTGLALARGGSVTPADRAEKRAANVARYARSGRESAGFTTKALGVQAGTDVVGDALKDSDANGALSKKPAMPTVETPAAPAEAEGRAPRVDTKSALSAEGAVAVAPDEPPAMGKAGPAKAGDMGKAGSVTSEAMQLGGMGEAANARAVQLTMNTVAVGQAPVDALRRVATPSNLGRVSNQLVVQASSRAEANRELVRLFGRNRWTNLANATDEEHVRKDQAETKPAPAGGREAQQPEPPGLYYLAHRDGEDTWVVLTTANDLSRFATQVAQSQTIEVARDSSESFLAVRRLQQQLAMLDTKAGLSYGSAKGGAGDAPRLGDDRSRGFSVMQAQVEEPGRPAKDAEGQDARRQTRGQTDMAAGVASAATQPKARPPAKTENEGDPTAAAPPVPEAQSEAAERLGTRQRAAASARLESAAPKPVRQSAGAPEETVPAQVAPAGPSAGDEQGIIDMARQHAAFFQFVPLNQVMLIVRVRGLDGPPHAAAKRLEAERAAEPDASQEVTPPRDPPPGAKQE